MRVPKWLGGHEDRGDSNRRRAEEALRRSDAQLPHDLRDAAEAGALEQHLRELRTRNGFAEMISASIALREGDTPA